MRADYGPLRQPRFTACTIVCYRRRMRVWLIVSMACLAGCGDDTTTMSHGGDLGAQAGGHDLAVAAPPDLAACVFGNFFGYPGANASPLSFDCPCGCMIDPFDDSLPSSNWGTSTGGGASFVAETSGTGMTLAWSAANTTPSLASLASEGPIARFYLDGDFDLQVDYALNGAAPPGESHLVLSVRKPDSVQSLTIYQVERARETDGTEAYATQLGGVPAVRVATAATTGTLRLTRAGFTMTSFADGQNLSTLIAQNLDRLEVTLAGELNGCSDADAGTTCSYQPSWHHLQLNQGTIVNQP
jgi:hypothetical protein